MPILHHATIYNGTHRIVHPFSVIWCTCTSYIFVIRGWSSIPELHNRGAHGRAGLWHTYVYHNYKPVGQDFGRTDAFKASACPFSQLDRTGLWHTYAHSNYKQVGWGLGRANVFKALACLCSQSGRERIFIILLYVFFFIPFHILFIFFYASILN